jgi:hypothetical protein
MPRVGELASNSLRLTPALLLLDEAEAPSSSASTVTKIRCGDRALPTSSSKVRFLGDDCRALLRLPLLGGARDCLLGDALRERDRRMESSCCGSVMSARRVYGRVALLVMSSVSGSGDEEYMVAAIAK